MWHTKHLPALVFDKSFVSQNLATNETLEAVWMPGLIHGLDDTATDELIWRRQVILNCFKV